MKYFEDIAIGDRSELGAHHFSADEIKIFAKRFDPQRFHVDEAQAEGTHFGTCASGWHTAVHVDAGDGGTPPARRRGEAPRASRRRDRRLARLQGHEMEQAGLRRRHHFVRTEVVETRPSNSKPEWGILQVHNTGTNQNGELVICFVSTTFVERRPAA